MKVSVIVPVYNKEQSIDCAIRSVLNQNLKDNEMELLLLDDGSTDSSLAICEKYSEQYSNIKVISKGNEGVAATRNLGINMAEGEYICFLDADDYLVPNAFNILISELFSDEFDVIEYSSTTITLNPDSTMQQEQLSDSEVLCDSTGHEILKKEGNTQFSSCTKWIKRSFLLSNNLYFEDLCIGEDVLFNLNLYYANPRIRRTSLNCYRYVTYDGEGQASRKRDRLFMRKCADSYMILFKRISEVNRELIQDNYDQQCLWPMFNRNIIPFTSRLLSSDLTRKEIHHIYKTLINLKLFPLIKANVESKICQMIIKSNCLFPINRFIYSKIFVQIILPKINRNSNIFTKLDPQKAKSLEDNK